MKLYRKVRAFLGLTAFWAAAFVGMNSCTQSLYNGWPPAREDLIQVSGVIADATYDSCAYWGGRRNKLCMPAAALAVRSNGAVTVVHVKERHRTDDLKSLGDKSLVGQPAEVLATAAPCYDGAAGLCIYDLRIGGDVRFDYDDLLRREAKERRNWGGLFAILFVIFTLFTAGMIFPRMHEQ